MWNEDIPYRIGYHESLVGGWVVDHEWVDRRIGMLLVPVVLEVE
jgi:hypothetical protein